MRRSIRRRVAALAFGLAVLAAAGGARAQAPPSAAAEVAACLCLRQDVDALSADLAAKQQAYDATRGELARLDSRLETERSRMDVNNPQSVAQFRQLLDQRDALFRRQRGPLFSEFSASTERYNARVNEYNARCTAQSPNPALVEQVRATLSCPPPR